MKFKFRKQPYLHSNTPVQDTDQFDSRITLAYVNARSDANLKIPATRCIGEREGVRIQCRCKQDIRDIFLKVLSLAKPDDPDGTRDGACQGHNPDRKNENIILKRGYNWAVRSTGKKLHPYFDV